MTVYTLFQSPLQSAWRGDVDDPTDGQYVGQLIGDTKQNILYRRIESIQLDDTDTRSITFAVASLAAEWPLLIAKVVGDASLNLVGVDTNGSTPITSKWRGYGTEIYPGFIQVSTYNVSTVTVEGHADGTEVELFAGIACEDDDPRLITNA